MYSNFVSRAEFDHLKLKYDEVCAINVQLNGEIAKLKQIINNSTKPPEIYQQQNCPQSNAISINRNYNHQPMDNNGYKIEDFAVGVSGHFLATPGLRPNEPIKPVNCQDDDFTFDSVQSKFLKVELKFSDDEEIRIPQAGNQTKKTKKKKKDKGNKKAKRKKRGKKKSTAKRGEMKFECHLCKLNTPKYLSVLRRHMSLKHIGVKALTCDHCGRKFKQIGNLNAHRIRIHIQTGERPFACDECQGRFLSKRELNAHKRIHTGIKPFACDQCEWKFADKGKLTRHKRTHTGEKYACDLCNTTFLQSGDLNRHKRQKHGAGVPT